MRKILVALFTALFAFTLVGCGDEDKSSDSNSTGASSLSKDDIFIAAVRDEYSFLNDVPSRDLIELAEVSCELFDAGGDRDDIIGLILAGDFEAEVGESIAFIIGAGVATYCPEHLTEIS